MCTRLPRNLMCFLYHRLHLKLVVEGVQEVPNHRGQFSYTCSICPPCTCDHHNSCLVQSQKLWRGKELSPCVLSYLGKPPLSSDPCSLL
ncbi:hypothetical protein FGO68_gene12499 [Halteria grandinella]|uniref:Uncharacterized protein n=1 Tax=Halteria grandinella TaxID=5974 RepID=A0A8J8P6H7_HALGN|nr:hypothetical protein FGO68_gene12499 [Halteria grandinella]